MFSTITCNLKWAGHISSNPNPYYSRCCWNSWSSPVFTEHHISWRLVGLRIITSYCCRNSTYITLNTLRPRQDGRLFPDDILKSIFFNEDVQTLIKISLTFVPKAPINNIPALVQIMAWRRPGDKPLFEPMMVSLQTHICVTRPQWVNMLTWDTSVGIQRYIWNGTS